MIKRSSKIAYGIDFGTSNSAVALMRDGVPTALPVGAGGRLTVPSILYFPPRSDDKFLIGEEAAAAYLANGMQGRLLQSIKSLLTIPDTHFGALGEKLIGSFLTELKSRADQLCETDVRSAVVGRPVIFSHDKDEDRKAEEKLLAAVHKAGFDECRLVPEPIAAARSFQTASSEPRLLLVADLGGGTSDFTLVRYTTTKTGKQSQKILGTSGVYVGGDELDSNIMGRRLGDFFGASSSFNWHGKHLPFPKHLVEMLTKPYLMPKLIRTRVFGTPLPEFLEDILPHSDDPVAVRHFRSILNRNLSYALFLAIENAKIGLAERDMEVIELDQADLQIKETLTRSQMDAILAPQVDKIWNCALGLLEQTGIKAGQVDQVILTGGTSFLQAINDRFTALFGSEKVSRQNAFLSVAEGLALESASTSAST